MVGKNVADILCGHGRYSGRGDVGGGAKRRGHTRPNARRGRLPVVDLKPVLDDQSHLRQRLEDVRVQLLLPDRIKEESMVSSADRAAASTK